PAGRLRARLDARLTLPQLTAVLQRLETAPPLLMVDAMTVATDPGRQAAGPAPMDVRLEIDAATPAPR
ncbi:MAG: GspMb/PilO family protein, partial [Janthinobacterium lividum]